MAEIEDGENGLPTGVIRRPIPDPTVLTSQQSRAVEERAIARELGLKELLLTHIKGLNDQINFQFLAAQTTQQKSEAATIKLLEQVQTTINTIRDATYDKIGTLERALASMDGRLQGTEKSDQKGNDASARYIAAAGLLVGIIAIVAAALIHPQSPPIPASPVITIPPVTAHG